MQVPEQVAVASQGFTRWICNPSLTDQPHGSSLCSVLHFQLQSQLCSIFCPISTTMLLIMKAELAFLQNMKVVALCVRVTMHQE